MAAGNMGSRCRVEMTIINGTFVIGEVSVDSLSVSSVLMTGDLKRISLVSCMETPLEPQTFEPEMFHDEAAE